MSNLSKKEQLELAIKLANEKHFHQVDKSGAPYIGHVTRVMNSFREDELDFRIIGILHDIVEDTDVTIDDLINMGFDKDLVCVISILTRRNDVEYFNYIKKIKTNKTATRIKLADLSDNMRAGCPERLLSRYIKAKEMLLEI